MKIYYAHCQTLYGTVQEERDIGLLMKLGFTVINPAYRQKHVQEMKANNATSAEIMLYFQKLVMACDALTFRSLPDGAIPAGVATEIEVARTQDMPVIELPSSVQRRTLSVDLTREYLRESGQK